MVALVRILNRLLAWLLDAKAAHGCGEHCLYCCHCPGCSRDRERAFM